MRREDNWRAPYFERKARELGVENTPLYALPSSTAESLNLADEHRDARATVLRAEAHKAARAVGRQAATLGRDRPLSPESLTSAVTQMVANSEVGRRIAAAESDCGC